MGLPKIQGVLRSRVQRRCEQILQDPSDLDCPFDGDDYSSRYDVNFDEIGIDSFVSTVIHPIQTTNVPGTTSTIPVPTRIADLLRFNSVPLNATILIDGGLLCHLYVHDWICGGEHAAIFQHDKALAESLESWREFGRVRVVLDGVGGADCPKDVVRDKRSLRRGSVIADRIAKRDFRGGRDMRRRFMKEMLKCAFEKCSKLHELVQAPDEADDVLMFLAKQTAVEGGPVVIVTADGDFFVNREIVQLEIGVILINETLNNCMYSLNPIVREVLVDDRFFRTVVLPTILSKSDFSYLVSPDSRERFWSATRRIPFCDAEGEGETSLVERAFGNSTVRTFKLFENWFSLNLEKEDLPILDVVRSYFMIPTEGDPDKIWSELVSDPDDGAVWKAFSLGHINEIHLSLLLKKRTLVKYYLPNFYTRKKEAAVVDLVLPLLQRLVSNTFALFGPGNFDGVSPVVVTCDLLVGASFVQRKIALDLETVQDIRSDLSWRFGEVRDLPEEDRRRVFYSRLWVERDNPDECRAILSVLRQCVMLVATDESLHLLERDGVFSLFEEILGSPRPGQDVDVDILSLVDRNYTAFKTSYFAPIWLFQNVLRLFLNGVELYGLRHEEKQIHTFLRTFSGVRWFEAFSGRRNQGGWKSAGRRNTQRGGKKNPRRGGRRNAQRGGRRRRRQGGSGGKPKNRPQEKFLASNPFAALEGI